METKFELAHIGINSANAEEAEKTAKLLAALFGLDVRANSGKAIFAGTYFECMCGPGAGANGHIGMAVEDVAAAVEELKARGVAFREDSAGYDSEGKLRIIYLADEIAGFAVHLVRK